MLKTYIRLTSSFYWPRIYSDILKHTKTCLRCQQKNQWTSLHSFTHNQHRTSLTGGFIQNVLDQCWQPDPSINTTSAIQMHLQNTCLSQPSKTKKRKLWLRPFSLNSFVNLASQHKFTQTAGRSSLTNFLRNFSICLMSSIQK